MPSRSKQDYTRVILEFCLQQKPSHPFCYILKTKVDQPKCKQWGNWCYLLMEGIAKSHGKGAQTQGKVKYWNHFLDSVMGSLSETCLQSPCSHTYSHTCCNKVTWRARPFLITRMRTQMGSKCQSHIILSSWPSLLYFLATPFHKAQSVFAPCSLISAIKHQDAFTPHLRGLQAGELTAPKPETWVC